MRRRKTPENRSLLQHAGGWQASWHLRKQGRRKNTHRQSRARSGSILARSLLMKSASSPANSVPVGPPPTTTVVRMRSRSERDRPARHALNSASKNRRPTAHRRYMLFCRPPASPGCAAARTASSLCSADSALHGASAGALNFDGNCQMPLHARLTQRPELFWCSRGSLLQGEAGDGATRTVQQLETVRAWDVCECPIGQQVIADRL